MRPGQGKIVAINDNQFKGHMVYQNLHADLYLEGDIAASLQALTQAARAAKLDGDALKKRRDKWTREHETMSPASKPRKRRHAATARRSIRLPLVETLGEVLPTDTIYVDETITHQPTIRQHLPFTTPQSFFRGFGGLGQGIGTALGVKLAARERPVVLLVGDGGFLYNPVIQALGASKQHELADPDRDFQQQEPTWRWKRDTCIIIRTAPAESAQMHLRRRDSKAPTTKQLGSHFGFHGERVEQPDKLKAALQSGA